MEFSRIGTNGIRCIISEEEINDLGFSIDEILANADKTQEFMNCIFDLAEDEFHTKFEKGFKTVRADFLPDHTVCLTFSENATQKKANGFMEQLLNYVNDMIAAHKEAKQQDMPTKSAKVLVGFYFSSMQTLCRFAKNIEMELLHGNELYKFRDYYCLMLDLTENSKEEVLRLSMLADEYANGLFVGSQRYAYVKEHGEVIIKEDAVQALRQI